MAFERPVERGFPFVRVLGGVALVALVSAMPTPPFVANGELGAAQFDALAACATGDARASCASW